MSGVRTNKVVVDFQRIQLIQSSVGTNWEAAAKSFLPQDSVSIKLKRRLSLSLSASLKVFVLTLWFCRRWTEISDHATQSPNQQWRLEGSRVSMKKKIFVLREMILNLFCKSIMNVLLQREHVNMLGALTCLCPPVLTDNTVTQKPPDADTILLNLC